MKKDEGKTKEQLLKELKDLRQRVTRFESVEAEHKQFSDIQIEGREQSYKDLVEASSNMIFSLDLSGKFLFVNKQWKKIIGYTIDEIRGTNGFELIHPDDLPLVSKEFSEVMKGIVVENIEFRSKVKDGSYKHILMNAAPVYNSQKNVVSIIGTAMDISEHKQVEEALEKQEEQYRLVIENANQGIVVVQDQMIKFHNDKLLEITGYSREELGSKPFIEFVYSDDREMLLSYHMKRYQGEEIPDFIQYRFYDKNNELKWVESNAVIIDWEGQPATIGFVSDITERKQAEEETRLLLGMTNAISEAQDFTSALRSVLTAICEIAGWEYGEAWIPSTDREVLERSDAWYGTTDIAKRFRKLTDNVTFRPNEGIRGRVWSSKKPEWFLEASGTNTELYPRRQLAREAGVRSGFSVPIVSDTQVLAILSFNMSEIRKENARLVELISSTALQLGSLIRHKQAEETISIQGEIFSNVSEGVGVIRINDGVIAFANPRFCEIFGYSKEELVGKHVTILNAPSKLSPGEISEEITRGLEKNGAWHGEVHNIKKDGTLLWTEASVSAFKHSVYGEVWITVQEDITERKQAEDALIESERNFRNSMDNSPLGIIILGDRLAPPNEERVEILYANKAILDLYGFKNIKEMRNTSLAERYTPETVIEVKERIAQREIGVPMPPKYIAEIINRGGETRSLEAFTREVVWDGLSRFQIIYNDVTERIQTERALQIAEQNFRNSMDISPVGIRVMNLDEELLYVNKALLNIYGYEDIEEMRNTPISKRLTPESHTEYLERTDSWKKEKTIPVSYEVNIITKNREVRTLKINRENVVWNNEVQLLVLCEDITERKRTEEALRLAEQNFRNSLDNSPLGIIIIGDRAEPPHENRSDIIYANKAILNIWGYDSLEQLRNIPLRERYTPESYRLLEGRTNLLEIGEPMLSKFEVDIVNIKGEIRHLEVNTEEVLWDNKNRTQLLYEDVTERKRLEDEREEIYQQVQIASRLASIGEMAAGIAHEINNPLTGVVGFADILAKRDLPEDMKKEVEMISEGGKRVADVTNRLLTFARHDRLQGERIDINEVIETTLEMRTSAMKVNNISVITELDKKLPKMVADGSQLQQVFLNIILNAEKEMRNAYGKGTLKVKTERINGAVRVSFSDDGPGIPEENLDKIFDPFFTTRNVGEGTGLGLSVSYGIISEQGGRIHAESDSGQGATFIIDLPLVIQKGKRNIPKP